ncbi:MAG: glycosyltransferase [Acidobacteriota bacterium]|nr:glycosyltransferase [Acidobacteriota bacterium]
MNKKKLKEALPFSVKRQFGKFCAGVLRLCLRVAAEVVRIAPQFGFDWKKEMPPELSGFRNFQNLPPFDLKDFLLLNEKETVVPQTVQASIIIICGNQVEALFQCLRSLFRAVDLSKNEIIVVDNASEDETPGLLEKLGNRVRVVRCETFIDFAEARNRGAAAASGEFLVFLSSNAIVQNGWLASLIETFETIETIGAVGTKQIFPNGRLREAGAIVWRDGSVQIYGGGENADDARFNFAREVDFCSSASLVVRKDLFASVGGYDSRFASGFYADMDLCLKIRAAGKKVIFQPASRVVVYENAETRFENFQEIDRQTFLEKWRALLEREHLPLQKSNILAASNRKRGGRIAVFCDYIPQPETDSSGVRMFAVLQSLSRLAHIVLVPIYHSEPKPEYEQRLGKIGIEIVSTFDFETRLRQEKFDAAILSYPLVADNVFSLVKRLLPEAKIIFDTVDVHFVRLSREFELTRDKRFAEESARYRKIEARLALAADQVWCVTEDDKKFLQAVAPEAKIEIVPNIHRLHGRGEPFAERRDLLFIGGFGHRPNVDAIFYFVNEIFPLVQERLPGVKIHIVGSRTPPEITALASETIRVEGFVPDVTPLFETARVFVAPLRFGAGMKGKIGQALSYGLPTVTTEIGAEGMNLKHEEEVLIAGNARKFAAEVVRLYQSEELWQHLSESGYRFIERNFAPPIIEGKIRVSLEKAFDGKRELHS